MVESINIIIFPRWDDLVEWGISHITGAGWRGFEPISKY